jgi:hypothetical protein
MIIAASGPSLTPEIAVACQRAERWYPCIAVNDAIRLFPRAVALIANDLHWWQVHSDELRSFDGRRIMPARYAMPAHQVPPRVQVLQSAECEPPRFIPFCAGQCSGFAAISYALAVRGMKRIVLVGFDARIVDGRRHFFGDHMHEGLRNTDPQQFVPDFERAAKLLPPDVEIINATPASALRCFHHKPLAEALADG